MLSFLKNFAASFLALVVFVFVVPLVLLYLLALPFIIMGVQKDVNLSMTPVNHDGGVLVYDWSQRIVEFPQPQGSNALFSMNLPTVISTYQIAELTRAVEDHPEIKAILIKGNLDNADVSIVQLNEIRNAFMALKEKVKIYAYLENPTTREYFLASVADEIILNPFSTFELNGLASNSPYFGAAMKKYGFTAQVIRAGEHKSFGDIFTKSKMDDSDRKILQTALDNIWNNIVKEISTDKKINRQKILEFVNTKVICSPKEALKLGFVDKLLYADELEAFMVSEYGGDKNGFYSYTPDVLLTKNKRASCAIVYMRGDIVEYSPSLRMISAERYVELLRQLREDKQIESVVLRIDSGGGSAYASELIRREVELLAKEKNVVASFGSVAASGAYWIATAAHKIFVDPNTITGSIGVFSLAFSVDEFAAKLGVDFDGVKTSPFADISTITRAKTDAEIKIEKSAVDCVYNHFVKLVADSRKLKESQVREFADGRIFTGDEAVDIGIADAVSTFYDVIACYASKDEYGRYVVLEYPSIDTFQEFIKQFDLMEEMVKVLPIKVKSYQKIFETISTYTDARGIYARLPYELQIK